MYFGSQYYRPPFPPKENWERDIRHFKELNFNVIKLWAVWNWVETEPGKFCFDELDELTALCEKEGIKVIINTIPEGAPYWLEGEHEDALYTFAEGEKLKFSGPANIPSGGWPGLCHDSRAGLDGACRFIYETARHFAGNDAVIAIDVWNEPHLEPMFDYPGRLLCYCEHSLEQFRAWLRSRYGTVEELNRAWFRKYRSFEDAAPPRRFGTAADMIDWRRFWLFNLRRWLRARTEAARKGAPGKIIQTHVPFSGYMGAVNHGGLGNELGDEFLLAPEVDSFGLSTFPLWLMSDDPIDGHLINLEIVAEACRGKPFYQTELQGGAGKIGLLGGEMPSASYVRQWNWSVIASGGKGVIYWQYLPEPAGLEAPGLGLVNSDGTDTERSLSASACAERFNTRRLTAAKRTLSKNAIFLSRDSDLFTYAALEEKKYTHGFTGVYKALTERGVPARFVHGDYSEHMRTEGVETLYLPMALSLTDNEKKNIAEFAESGGTVIFEPCSGVFGENGALDMDFSFPNSLFGMKNNEIQAIEPDSLMEAFLINGGRFSVKHYRQVFKSYDPDADILARFDDGKPALLRKKLGAGTVYWLCGYAGLAYYETKDAATGDFIASLFSREGYACLKELECDNMLVRILEDDSRYYLICVNRELRPGRLRAVTADGQVVECHIPADDGAIIEIAK